MNAKSNRRLSFKVTGMTCGGCVRSVRKILANVNGVRDLDVRVGSVTVLIDPERAELSDITVALQRAGYRPDLTDLIDQEPNGESSQQAGSAHCKVSG